jgi:pimeloyl-ACP methyl ester carboxylesterase
MLRVFSDGESMVTTSDGVKIFYRRIGQGSKALLFMHGWGGNGSGSFWNQLLRHIYTEDLSMVMVDLRGHSRSDHTRDGFTTERFAEDMFDLATHLELDKLIVVGYSMSGRWAQWMSCVRPEQISGQILIAPVPALALSFHAGMVDEWIRQVSTREGFHGLERQFMMQPVPSDILDDCFNAIEGTPEHTLRETLKMCTETSFVEKLSAIRTPTIVIGGIHDPMGPPEYLEREIVRKIPGARLSLLSCGHNLPLEMPLETAAVINGFVSGLSIMAAK